LNAGGAAAGRGGGCCALLDLFVEIQEKDQQIIRK
jgi:hypothetical protein